MFVEQWVKLPCGVLVFVRHYLGEWQMTLPRSIWVPFRRYCRNNGQKQGNGYQVLWPPRTHTLLCNLQHLKLGLFSPHQLFSEEALNELSWQELKPVSGASQLWLGFRCYNCHK